MPKLSDGDPTEFLTRNGARKQLAVLLHGYTQSPKNLAMVRDAITQENVLPDMDVFCPPLPLSTFSTADPDALINDLLGAVDVLLADRRQSGDDQGYEDLYLIGHSCGSVLVRKLYVAAWGANDTAEIVAANAKPWARKIRRVVLLAGVNRGWSITSAISPIRGFGMTIGSILGEFLRGDPIIFAIRRGAPFLTVLRLQWLALEEWFHDTARVDNALVVQLLGTVDDLVSPEDNIDLDTGSKFIYLEVPGSGHLNVVDIDDTAIGKGRRTAIESALTAPIDRLDEQSVDPRDIYDDLDPGSDKFDTRQGFRRISGVHGVAFVIHGIRDRGFWTKKIARRINEKARSSGKTFRSVTASYGYFAMLPFISRFMRQSKVEWLLDQYVTTKSLYPGARFYYVGHSNGTYLAASALLQCKAVKFDRIVFAGSVVRRDFDWRLLIKRGQVKRVLNYVATGDWVVAIFPKALQTLNWQDLGSAGHDGFDPEPTGVVDIEYVAGAHAAALDEHNWTGIAGFIVDDDTPRPTGLSNKRGMVTKLAGWVSPGLLIGAAALVLAAGFALLIPLFDSSNWYFAILFAAYLALVRLVVTKV